MNESTKQVIIAGVSAAVATTVGVLITHWLTKQATIENVASGKTPLPADATPTFKEETKKEELPKKKEEPKEDLVAQAAQIAQGGNSNISMQLAIPKCPSGYHWGNTDEPPYLPGCVPD